MSRIYKPIAAVQGASSVDIQLLFMQFANRWRQSIRIAGVIEESEGAEADACGAGHLVKISNGARFRLFQDLGRGSSACCLDPAGVVTACEDVVRDIISGCDLVILSKFAKLEVGGSGLTAAFATALEYEVPVITAVSPVFQESWNNFAAPYFEMLPPNAAAIDDWWQASAPLKHKLAS
jgi:stage V sporulation protein SpoVS